MRWTSTPPNTAGFYWVRHKFTGLSIASVSGKPDSFFVQVIGRKESWAIADFPSLGYVFLPTRHRTSDGCR